MNIHATHQFPTREKIDGREGLFTSVPPHTKPYKMSSRTANKRIALEMAQFDDKAYVSEFESVKHLAFNKVQVHMYDGSIYIVERSEDFITAPTIYAVNDDTKNKKMAECSIEFSLAYTSAKWLLVMHCLL